MLALALALRNRGHHVTVCTAPDSTEWIGSLGLTAHAVGINMGEFVARANAGLSGIRYAMRALPELVGCQYAAMEPMARDCDVMLGSSLTAAGASFAEKLGLRYHYVSFTPCVIPSAEHPNLFIKSQTLPGWVNRLSWWQYRLQNNLGLKPVVNAERKKLGLKPISDVWAHLLHEKLIIASDPALGALPAEAPSETRQIGTWFLPEPPSQTLSPELEAFCGAGAPPIYIGFGSMPDRQPQQTLRWILSAVREAGVRALVVKGTAQLPELPPHVLAIGPTPHGKLFARCAAVVHHGGAGTTAYAARAGVPQVLLPHMTDQFYWRQRLLERGLTPGRVGGGDSRALAQAMRRCVEDGDLRERARAMASMLVTDAVERAVRFLDA